MQDYLWEQISLATGEYGSDMFAGYRYESGFNSVSFLIFG